MEQLMERTVTGAGGRWRQTCPKAGIRVSLGRMDFTRLFIVRVTGYRSPITWIPKNPVGSVRVAMPFAPFVAMPGAPNVTSLLPCNRSIFDPKSLASLAADSIPSDSVRQHPFKQPWRAAPNSFNPDRGSTHECHNVIPLQTTMQKKHSINIYQRENTATMPPKFPKKKDASRWTRRTYPHGKKGQHQIDSQKTNIKKERAVPESNPGQSSGIERNPARPNPAQTGAAALRCSGSPGRSRSPGEAVVCRSTVWEVWKGKTGQREMASDMVCT